MNLLTEEIERNLACNIGFLATRLREAGFNLLEIDKIGQRAIEFIENQAEQATISNPLQTQNVENVIIMLLMHGAILSQRKFLEETAGRIGVSKEKLLQEMIKDTLGEIK